MTKVDKITLLHRYVDGFSVPDIFFLLFDDIFRRKADSLDTFEIYFKF